jgi:hypothetical protein
MTHHLPSSGKWLLFSISVFPLWIATGAATGGPSRIDLSKAVVVVRQGDLPTAEQSAREMLIEEVESRTGIAWTTTSEWPSEAPAVIAVVGGDDGEIGGHPVPRRQGEDLPEKKSEGFRLRVQSGEGAQPVVWILGADPRGTVFGVGAFLRKMTWASGVVAIDADLDLATSPDAPIRGHQLGYRNRANAYDAWTPEVYEQHIRELAVFGTNAIENIPFQDDTESPHMPVSREEMNAALGAICKKYDLDYWVWTPATFPLGEAATREAHLKDHIEFYKKTPRLDHVFFPGGDPGDNPPELVLPFLADLYGPLQSYHPGAGIWLSLQGFEGKKVDYVFDYLQKEQPDWLMGLVGGPSSPPLDEMRKRLPAKYQLREYPDITHTVRAQYPTEWLDQAFALTLGREAINPEPVYYAEICRFFTPFTDGFVSYSDGVNDDVNKVIWSQAGWDLEAEARQILLDYANFFFGSDMAVRGADGILALEKNWRGPLDENGAVEATQVFWRSLDEEKPALEETSWRWVMCQFRAEYDAYTRHRLLYETRLEEEVNKVLLEASDIGSEAAMKRALEIYARAGAPQALQAERARVFELGDQLKKLIGMQLSVERHGASGAERGASLDFIDYPLNNRWWVEDRFTEISKLEGEQERIAQLHEIANWENPGKGSYYDNLGQIGACPHVIRGEDIGTDPLLMRDPNPGYWWWDNGLSRRRLSWQVTMDAIIGMRYDGLDPEGNYLVRLTGQRESLLKIDGEKVEPTKYSHEIGQFKEFPVPAKALEDGKIELTWDWPDESHLNWRQTSHLAEVWLLKQ